MTSTLPPVGKFSVIAPDVIIVGDKKLIVSKLPSNALLKVHKLIVNLFSITTTYKNTIFDSHIRLIHSLNEMYPAEPTTDDIELFRGHIVKFVGVWFDATKYERSYSFLPSLKAMTGSQSSNSGSVLATVTQESSDVAAQVVQISDSGNLSLTKKCEPVASCPTVDNQALDALRLRVDALRQRLSDCAANSHNVSVEQCFPAQILALDDTPP